jgi:hypothetical protein
MGKLRTLVNKFMGLNRVYGIIYVFITIIDRGVHLAMTDHSNSYCYLIEVSIKFLALGFCMNNIIIALIR